MYKDIRQVREHYAALRDVIAQHVGGRDDAATRTQVAVLRGGDRALDDTETRQRLRAVDRHAAELFSNDEHRKWDRQHMSGADYLRLQIFIALEGREHAPLLPRDAARPQPVPGDADAAHSAV